MPNWPHVFSPARMLSWFLGASRAATSAFCCCAVLCGCGQEPTLDESLALLSTNPEAAASALAGAAEQGAGARALFGLGLAYEQLGDLARAQSALERAVLADARHVDTRLALARVYVLQLAFEKARAELEQVTRLRPELLGNRLMYAAVAEEPHQWALARERLSAWKRDAKAGKQEVPTEWYSVMSNLAYELGDVNEGATFRQAAGSVQRTPAGFELALVDIYFSRGGYASAKRLLEVTLSREPRHRQANLRLAEVALRLGEAGTAEQALSRLPIHMSATPDILRAVAEHRSSSGHFVKAAESFRKLALLTKGEAQTRARLLEAQAWARARRFPEATAVLGILLKENGHFEQALILQSKLLLAQDNFAEALEQLKRNLKTESLAVYDLLCRVYLKRQRFGSAEMIARQYMERAPKSIRAVELLALSLTGQERHGAADQLLRAALSEEPERLELIKMRTNSLRARGGVSRALSFLEFHLKQIQARAPILALVGKLYEQDNQFAQAQRAYSQAVAEDPHLTQAWVAWFGLQPDPGLAQRALVALESKQGGGSGLAIARARFASVAGDYRSAIQYYRRALDFQPESLLVLNNLAVLLLRDASTQPEGLELAERAYRAAPKKAAVVDTYGWGLFKNGELHRALGLLGYSASRLKDAVGYYHLGEVQQSAGEIDAARASLRQALKLDPKFALAQRSLAALEE